MAGLLLAGSLSFAQVNNYYVSNSGSDANSAASVLNSGGSVSWATMQHAMGLMSPGSSGTILNVAAGTYPGTNSICGVTTNFCANQDGTPTARLTIQCSNPVTGCKLTGAPVGGYDAIIKANYVDFVGFEVGPCSGCNAGIAILGGTVFGNKGTNIHILNNYVHDVAQSGNDGNGFGNGCPSSGMIIADFKGQNIPGLQVIGNRINNGGLMSLTSCNQFHGLYVNGATLVQNNLISNVVGEGINFGPSPCGGSITGNTVIHNGQRGILIASYAGDNCAPDGHMTVNMNVADNNGVNNPGVGNGIGESGAVGTTNLYANNLLQGNSAGDSIALQTNPPSSIVNLKHEATSSTFTTYSDSGLGTYTLKTGSVAIGGGTLTCASGGFPPPCAPVTDFAGTARPSPPSIGALEAAVGTPIPHVSPASSNFATTRVGSCSAPQLVTVSNTGTASYTITPASTVTGTNAVDFPFSGTGSCTTGQVLAAGQQCTVSNQFCPASAGARAAQLNVLNTAPSGTLVAAFSGTATQPALAPISPITFPGQNIGTTSAPMNLALSNTGTATLNVSGRVFSGPFSASGNGTCGAVPFALVAGANCSFPVVVAPLTLGSLSGSVALTHDAPGSPTTVSLSGAGTQPGGSFSPTSFSFPSQTINTSSSSQPVVWTNNGTGPTTITAVSITGNFSQTSTLGALPVTVPSGNSITFNVVCTPTVIGAVNGQLTITDNAPSPTQIATLSGIGQAVASNGILIKGATGVQFTGGVRLLQPN